MVYTTRSVRLHMLAKILILEIVVGPCVHTVVAHVTLVHVEDAKVYTIKVDKF